MSAETKYCEDCKHFRPAAEQKNRGAVKFARCTAAPDGQYHLIAPDLGDFNYCNAERAASGKCGLDAKRFEPKVAP